MQARQTWHRRFGAGSAGRGRNRRRPPRRLEVSSEGQARGAWRSTKGMPSGRGPAHRCRRSARARKGWGTAGRSRRQARLAETRGRRCAGRACNGLRRALALCRLLPRLGWGSLCVAFGPPGSFRACKAAPADASDAAASHPCAKRVRGRRCRWASAASAENSSRTGGLGAGALRWRCRNGRGLAPLRASVGAPASKSLKDECQCLNRLGFWRH
jgi:hypothetical protein